LCKKKKWIIEGVYSDWIDYGINEADLVVLLKIPKTSLFWRVTKRTLKRERQKQLGQERFEQNFKDFVGLLKAINKYYKKNYDRGYYKHKELIDKNKVKFAILKTNEDINNFFKGIS